MFVPGLIKIINHGRCFALVGSGPSCEMGYRSWAQLAAATYKQLTALGLVKDQPSYQKYLDRKSFPELFRQAEIDVNSRVKLLEIIEPLLAPEQKTHGRIYELLVKWPFACYLTTNYDDEISKHLAATGLHYQTVRNRREDFYSLRDGASHMIVKLHSDLAHADECVLTSLDYKRLTTDDEGKYFRDRLRAIFEMFDVCIVGHSLTDSDLSLILQTAQQTSSPNHPIFCIVSDATPAEQRDFLEKYNIVVIPYDNPDGHHAQLRRLLSVADKFIVPRGQRPSDAFFQPLLAESEIEAAAALLIYRRLHGSGEKAVASPTEYIGPLVLQALRSIPEPGVTVEDLVTLQPLAITVNSDSMREAVRRSLDGLRGEGLVKHTDSHYVLSPKGCEQLAEIAHSRSDEEAQAYGQFAVNLKASFPSLTPEQKAQAIALLKDAVVRIFKARGLSVANAVFSDQSVRHEDLTDIFAKLSTASSAFPPGDLRAAFVEAAHGFIIEPTTPQKKYLDSLSQGYFLYHMAGLDPLCTKIRRELFRSTAWLFDSSVLLPLVAIGCHNHDYATDLFSRLSSLNATTFTTARLLKEAWDHLLWAVDFVRSNPYGSANFLMAALVKGGFKQNLFIDGFVRLSADGRVSTFGDYLDLVCPEGHSQVAFNAHFARHQVSVLTMREMVGFNDNDMRVVSDYQQSIRSERISRGTFRNDAQVEAEAEVLHLIRKIRGQEYSIPHHNVTLEKVYFVSQSRILDIVSVQEQLITWTPETFYRYLTSLPGEQTDPELLQQCMLHEYYYAGVSFIDKTRYLNFFGPSINVARASYNQEKSKYLRLAERVNAESLDKAFDLTPDLEKPFFVAQMGWRAAEAAQRRETIAIGKVKEAEAKVKELETKARKKAKIAEENERARLRNLKDPQHQKKLIRQAKKRAHKKKR